MKVFHSDRCGHLLSFENRSGVSGPRAATAAAGNTALAARGLTLQPNRPHQPAMAEARDKAGI
jgi:hypothetical protein